MRVMLKNTYDREIARALVEYFAVEDAPNMLIWGDRGFTAVFYEAQDGERVYSNQLIEMADDGELYLVYKEQTLEVVEPFWTIPEEPLEPEEEEGGFG